VKINVILIHLDIFINFSIFTANSEVHLDIVKVTLDNVATIHYWYNFGGMAGDGTDGILACPLGDAALFHAISRTRNPEHSFR
jgi:hypothetical protein